MQPRTPHLTVIHSPASAQTIATPLLSETNQFRYRATPVFAAPPWPVLLGADCVGLGPLAVDDGGLRFIAYAIAATISTTTTRAPMPHPARRAGSVDVRGGSVGSWEVIRRSCCGSQTNVWASVAVPPPCHAQAHTMADRGNISISAFRPAFLSNIKNFESLRYRRPSHEHGQRWPG